MPVSLCTPQQKLRKAYKNVPTPVETHVTRWGSDPWARGSYSYFAVGNPKGITGGAHRHSGRGMAGVFQV